MRGLTKALVYLVLSAGAVLFLIPLAWMISTGLKPIDQTMSMPPTWIPYERYILRDGKRLIVTQDELLDQASLIVRRQDNGERLIVPAARVDGDVLLQRSGDAGVKRIAVTVEQEIPATPEAPWVRVHAAAGSIDDWWVLPTAELQRRAAPRWGNFVAAVKAMGQFPRYLRNTLLLCLLTVTGTVLSSSLAAYGFSRIEWRGRNKVFLIVLLTMMIPFPVLMVPLYSMFKWLGWIGTLRPLWVGSFFAGAFNVFLLRQFFMTIPKELSEAARIDGCSEFRIFWQIMLPLCRPALMVVGLFQFMFTWNDFLGPLIFLTDQRDFTLALGLQFFQSQHGGTEWHYLMAASSLIVLPIIVLFFFTQRTFIEGISMTGLKA